MNNLAGLSVFGAAVRSTVLRRPVVAAAALALLAQGAPAPSQAAGQWAPLLGSLTTDQVYTPVTPCRFVDGINAADRVSSAAGGTTARYYRVRGSTYAALLLLRALKDDQAALVQSRQLGLAWNETTDALDRATALHPAMVGRADLTEQGYYLLLARNKLAVLSAAAGAQR